MVNSSDSWSDSASDKHKCNATCLTGYYPAGYGGNGGGGGRVGIGLLTLSLTAFKRRKLMMPMLEMNWFMKQQQLEMGEEKRD